MAKVKGKNAKRPCTTINTTAKIKMKPIKRKRKYIPKMKCVVEGCKALSRGNGVGEKVNIVFVMEGEDILGIHF